MLKKYFLTFISALLFYIPSLGLTPSNVTLTQGHYPLEIKVEFTFAEGWHTYSPNDKTGYPPKLNWQLPPGYTLTLKEWPKDSSFLFAGVQSNGYKDKLTLFYTITPPPNKKGEHLAIKATIDWLVCKDVCIPMKAERSIDIALTNTAIIHYTFPMLFIIFAFLGGLLLNLMPCVFPVLSIKVLNLIQSSQEHKSRLSIHNGLFAVGILISLWALFGLAIFLKYIGLQIGWGFHLQSPYFVGITALFFIAFGLNLLGFFEIGLMFTRFSTKTTNHYARSFWTGVLTTLVATPCTAPFMGVAIGYAFSTPYLINGFLIFTALGIGISAPYILVTSFPQLLSRLPKPGHWMDTFKKILSVPMFLTAFWLLWVLSQQVHISSPSLSSNALFSEQHIELLLKENKKVFVKVDADWCLSCKVNDQIVFKSDDIVSFIKSNDINIISADWTNQDPNISKFLAKYGRNSVPFYVYYQPNKKPVILPVILTKSLFKEALSN